MVELNILSPVATTDRPKIESPKRLSDLNDKTIGLYWNGKAGGDILLKQAGECLAQRYSGIKIKFYGPFWTAPDRYDIVAKECDAVITATGDCGACTSGSVVDTTEAEKRGRPAVLFVAQRFVGDAESTARAFGFAGIALAVIPTPATNQPEDRLRQMAIDAMDQIIKGLTSPVPRKTPKARPSEIIKYQADDLLEASKKMNRLFIDEGWSDGFPLIPPTPQAVEEMLTGTSLSRDKVLGLLEPGYGITTIEKVAINAVMAGCRPEHLPVIITAVQCFFDPRALIVSVAVSTAPNAPMILVNGPIAKKININSKHCALGPGSISYANTVIGRAIRLILMNIGHAYPGTGDMDTQGLPTKYSMCIAENEDDSPWAPYHVDKGYSKEASTVTVHWNYGVVDVLDFWNSTPESVVEKYSRMPGAREGGAFNWLNGHFQDPRPYAPRVDVKEHNFILMGPDHAKVFAKGGWDKEKVRQEIYNKARLPLKIFLNDPKHFKVGHPELQWLLDYPDIMIPVMETPECYDIAVVGADVGRGVFCWGKHEPITKAIDPEVMPK